MREPVQATDPFESAARWVERLRLRCFWLAIGVVLGSPLGAWLVLDDTWCEVFCPAQIRMEVP